MICYDITNFYHLAKIIQHVDISVHTLERDYTKITACCFFMNKQSKIDPAISSALIAKAIKWPASARVGHHYHSMEISPLSTMASDAGMCLLLVDGTCGAGLKG